MDKTKEWSGCQGNTTKESELDPVGKGESLRDLSCTLHSVEGRMVGWSRDSKQRVH